MDDLMFFARAVVLADLVSRHRATPAAIDALEDALAQRQWWAEQWPQGRPYVAGLVAQDVQDALIEAGQRWPACLSCVHAPEHNLYIHPDLGGPDPMWICEETAEGTAPLGHL